MDLFIENILNNFNHIPGISGELNLAEAFKQKWVEETKCTAELYMKLRCYKLEKVNEYNRPDGIFRKAIINDIETLKKYKIEFNKQNNEPINDDEKLFRSMEDDIKSELYYVWENKKIVSMAKKVRPTKNGMAINNVYTSKEYRNRGYGTVVVSELSKSILNSGKIFCTLFTDLANPISNSIYQKIGYKKVCDNINYSFKFLT